MPAEPKRVIIADPVDKNRQSLALFLKEKGLDVIEAPDGSRALAEALLRKPDALLLDLSAPILPPERLVQILRSNPNTREMPILFFSDQERSIAGFRPGVDQFIRRPFQEEEVLQRIQRLLYADSLSEAFAGDSEISGNLSQFSVPDLWQMLSMNRKSGVLQVEGERAAGSIYIERGDIVSASTRNLVGEKALFRLIPMKEGKFRFLPGKVGVRRTIFTPNQHTILEGMRHDDELKRIGDELPSPLDSVEVVGDGKEVSPAEGAVREVLMLAGFCTRVEEIVDNCHFPDLVVYKALLSLKEREILRIGPFEPPASKAELLSGDDLREIDAQIEKKPCSAEDGSLRIVFFLPDPALLEELVQALGKYRDFEVDKVFFSLRGKEGIPVGVFGRLRAGESGSVLLNAFPYQRSISPLWYGLAPAPLGIVVFLKDGLTGSLENLMAVSEYVRGSSTRVLLAITGKTFTEFGLGENTLRLFRNRLERLGCALEVREMEEVTPAWIRDRLLSVLRRSPETEGVPS